MVLDCALTADMTRMPREGWLRLRERNSDHWQRRETRGSLGHLCDESANIQRLAISKLLGRRTSTDGVGVCATTSKVRFGAWSVLR